MSGGSIYQEHPNWDDVAALIVASSGEFVSEGRALASHLVKAPAKFPAGGVEGSLLIFAAVIEKWPAVFDYP